MGSLRVPHGAAPIESEDTIGVSREGAVLSVNSVQESMCTRSGRASLSGLERSRARTALEGLDTVSQ